MHLTLIRALETLIARAISQVTCVRRCVRFLEQRRAMKGNGSALDGRQLPKGILIRMPDLALFFVALRRLASPQKWSGRWESNPRLKLGKLGYYHYTTPALRPILVGFCGVGKSLSVACRSEWSHSAIVRGDFPS